MAIAAVALLDIVSVVGTHAALGTCERRLKALFDELPNLALWLMNCEGAHEEGAAKDTVARDFHR